MAKKKTIKKKVSSKKKPIQKKQLVKVPATKKKPANKKAIKKVAKKTVPSKKKSSPKKKPITSNKKKLIAAIVKKNPLPHVPPAPDVETQFKKDNQFWKQRSKHGRDTLFAAPELLLEAAMEYFQWCEDHPLKEQKAFSFEGSIIKTGLKKMRPFTLTGLCLYLGCNDAYFRQFNLEKNPGFSTIFEQIEQIIYTQKFEGAAAGLLNGNIIARDLNLKDSKEHSGMIGIQQITGMKIV